MFWKIFVLVLIFLVGIAITIYGLFYNRASKEEDMGPADGIAIGDNTVIGFILSIVAMILFVLLWEKMPWWLNKILIILFGIGMLIMGYMLYQEQF